MVVAHKILETAQSPNASFPLSLDLGLGLGLVNSCEQGPRNSDVIKHRFLRIVSTFSELWRWFSATAAIRRMGLLLLILLSAQLLLECGGARLPSSGPPPEGARAALPGVLVTVSGHSARVPPSLPDRVLGRAVRR